MNGVFRGLAAFWLAACMLSAEAAQVCRDDIAATAPDSRYRENGDGTVTDLSTGLIWKQCAEGLSGAGCASGSAGTFFTWQQALQHAADAVFAGSALWRLPNINELASLVERRCYSPAINVASFPNTPSDSLPFGSFWSSSPDASHGYQQSLYAWYVYFGSGSVYHDLFKFDSAHVRLVRAGQ